ncbi:hypothetical protein NJ76_30505 [Rhodococcus sp. IITR03]|nr:hypothetical protein NJ76_30505 [Rhodococcus sp. IITR03]
MRGWSDESLLETYDLERRAAAIENIDVTSSTMDFLVPQNESQRERRARILDCALTDPSTKAQVDSGRLSEPFWYADSPLTTRSERRPCEGRPEKGKLPRPAPGVLIPDAPVAVDGGATHLRALCRDGLTALCGTSVNLDRVRQEMVEVVRVPVRVYRIGDIDVEGVIVDNLEPADDDVWLVRPDAYIAAVSSASDLEEVRGVACAAVTATTGPGVRALSSSS